MLHSDTVSPTAEKKSFFRISEPVFLLRISKEPVWTAILMPSGCVDRMVGKISISSLTDVSEKIIYFLSFCHSDILCYRVPNQNGIYSILCGVDGFCCPHLGCGIWASPNILVTPWLSFGAISLVFIHFCTTLIIAHCIWNQRLI